MKSKILKIRNQPVNFLMQMELFFTIDAILLDVISDCYGTFHLVIKISFRKLRHPYVSFMHETIKTSVPIRSLHHWANKVTFSRLLKVLTPNNLQVDTTSSEESI